MAERGANAVVNAAAPIASAIYNSQAGGGAAFRGPASAADSALGGWPSSTGRMAANVAADVVGAVPSSLAAGADALSHTAENFGLAKPGPSLPIVSEEIKRATGIRPYAQNEGVLSPAALENILAIAAGNWRGGAPILTSLVKGVTGDIAQGVGGWLGGKAANATDPQGRLTELGQMTGSLAPGMAPKETIGSGVARVLGLSGDNAGRIYDWVRNLGLATGNPDLMPTAGMVGSPGVAALERGGAAFPLINIPIKSAQGKVAEAVKGGVQKRRRSNHNAGEAAGHNPGAPGALLQQGAQDDLTRRWNAAKSAIDQGGGRRQPDQSPGRQRQPHAG